MDKKIVWNVDPWPEPDYDYEDQVDVFVPDASAGPPPPPNCKCPQCLKAKGIMPAAPTPELAFVMYKPDAFERGLVGELMRLVDEKGLQLIQAKSLKVTADQLAKHYAHHVGKSFWPEMVDFYTSGLTLACIYKAIRANDSIRQLIGSKHPSESPPGSIRGKYATTFPKNLMHGSDTASDAQREMQIFFTKDELAQIPVLEVNTALVS